MHAGTTPAHAQQGLRTPSRRSVIRAAAWTAPAVTVAVAAPAFAASSPGACATGNYTIRWADHYNANTRSATALLVGSGAGTLGNAPLTLTVSSQFSGDMTAGSSGDYSNLRVSPGSVGGTGRRGLTIMQRATTSQFAGARSNHRQVVTLTFNRPVSNLRFSLTDIDSLDEPGSWWYDPPGQYQDRISVSGNPSGARAAQVVGAGTSGNPWRNSSTNSSLDPVTSGAGNVVVDYTGQPATQSISITYWNDQAGQLASQGLQGVFVTDLTFSAASC